MKTQVTKITFTLLGSLFFARITKKNRLTIAYYDIEQKVPAFLGKIWCILSTTFKMNTSLLKLYLCHCNDIRNNTVGLKTPEMAASAGKTRLNLICYAKASCFSNGAIHRGQISRRQL